MRLPAFSLSKLIGCPAFAAFLFLPSGWGSTFATAQAPTHADSVTLTPAAVYAGAPELIRVHAPAAQSVTGDWLGHTIEFFRQGSDWYALAGVDVEAPVGPSTLHLTAQTASGSLDLIRSVAIEEPHYRTGTLSVAPRFTSPNPEEMQQIEAGIEIKKRVFATSANHPLWSGDFRVPVKAAATDSFGARRTFNGKLASIHKGADFRAHMGTPVHAANSGIVVLARRLYFEGNCVVIGHGLGLYTIYMHFSRIDVKEGQQVKTGDLIGLSGATGRVTGPHLHWAVRWQDAYLDPLKLLRLNLNALP